MKIFAISPAAKSGKEEMNSKSKHAELFTSIKMFQTEHHEVQSQPTRNKRSLEYCLLTWFNIAYYSCVCPFRIRKKRGLLFDKYYLHRNLLQQVRLYSLYYILPLNAIF